MKVRKAHGFTGSPQPKNSAERAWNLALQALRLTLTAELHYLAWKRLADELGLAFDKEQNEALKGVSRMEAFEIILKNNRKTNAYSPAEKEALTTRKNEYYKALVETLSEKDILPAMPELLVAARAAGLKNQKPLWNTDPLRCAKGPVKNSA